MKYSYLTWLMLFLCSFSSLCAQRFTPPPSSAPMHFPTYFYKGEGTSIMKHHFTIAYTDGRDTNIYTLLVVDSPAYYLTMENKAVGKKDPGRHIRIYPSQTKYISHLDPTTGKEFVGMTSDSCWLFKVQTGKMSAYTSQAEIVVEDKYIRYIQVDDGPLVAVTDPEAGKLFGADESALELFRAEKYNKAVKRYNKGVK